MIIRITDDFDPERIAQSGQCFRWEKMEGETWRIITGHSCLYLTPLGDDRYEFDCPEDEYENFRKTNMRTSGGNILTCRRTIKIYEHESIIKRIPFCGRLRNRRKAFASCGRIPGRC